MRLFGSMKGCYSPGAFFLNRAKHTETILYSLFSIIFLRAQEIGVALSEACGVPYGVKNPSLLSYKNQYMIKKEATQIKRGFSLSPIIKTEQQKR